MKPLRISGLRATTVAVRLAAPMSVRRRG